MLVRRNSSLVQSREMPILVRNMLTSDRHKRRDARHAIRTQQRQDATVERELI